MLGIPWSKTRPLPTPLELQNPCHPVAVGNGSAPVVLGRTAPLEEYPLQLDIPAKTET
jgi:hypothetical protein